MFRAASRTHGSTPRDALYRDMLYNATRYIAKLQPQAGRQQATSCAAVPVGCLQSPAPVVNRRMARATSGNSKIFAFFKKIVLSGTDRLASAPAASQQRRPGATSLGYAAFEPFSKGLFNASSSRSGYGISSAPIVRTKPRAPQIPSIYGIGLRAQAISLRGSMLNSKKPINFFGTCFGARIALLEGNRVGPGAAVPKIEAAR